MATTNTYLNFNGNCEEAFIFYKAVFGGEFTHLARYSEMPPSPEYSIKKSDADKIMHVSLPIGQSTLMGSDSFGEAKTPKDGNSFYISVTADSREEANRLFHALAEGGHITMPLADAFWGDYFGMLTDKFGINWMMSYSS